MLRTGLGLCLALGLAWCCAAGFDDVLVVLGSEHDAILGALEGLPVRHAVNLQFASGMGSSFRTAAS